MKGFRPGDPKPNYPKSPVSLRMARVVVVAFRDQGLGLRDTQRI